jgi:hypothetical protein
MIESGELVGEREPLGGSRERYRVRMPQEASGTPQQREPPPSTPDAPETPQDAPAATTGLLEILDTLLRANGETMERQADRILDLTLRVGRAEARAEMLQDERDRARKALAEYAERLRAAEARLARRWWRFWE